MKKLHTAKTRELQRAMEGLGQRLDKGDESTPFVEVIAGQLACTYRPLRRHFPYGGPQCNLPAEAASALLNWVRCMRGHGFNGLICLMGAAEFRHYDAVVSELAAKDLIDLYEKHGFEVRRVPWEDPKYKVALGGPSYKEQLLEAREEALRAFDELPKPVLLHCSSGIQRSSPVAAFIYSQRSGQRN